MIKRLTCTEALNIFYPGLTKRTEFVSNKYQQTQILDKRFHHKSSHVHRLKHFWINFFTYYGLVRWHTSAITCQIIMLTCQIFNENGDQCASFCAKMHLIWPLCTLNAFCKYYLCMFFVNYFIQINQETIYGLILCWINI